MKTFLKKYNIQLKLLLGYAIGLIFLGIIYYFLLPFILNYPAGTYGTKFQYELEQANYLSQIILIAFVMFAIFAITTFYKTHFLVKFHDLIENPKKYTLKEINFVKDKLISTPYSLFILNIIIPSIVLPVLHAITIKQLEMTTLKIFLLVVTLMTSYVTALFIYTNSVFKNILLNLPFDDTTGIKRSSLKKRVIFNILPLFLASVLFTALLGYTKVAKETGNSLFHTYKDKLDYFCNYEQFNNISDLLAESKKFNLSENESFFFVRTSNGDFYNCDGQKIHFSDFFIKYLNEMSESNEGRVYEYYGIDKQGVVSTCIVNGAPVTIGFYYTIITQDSLTYFGIAFLLLFIMNLIVLILFANSIIDDIKTVSNRFSEIAENENSNLGETLSLTSNDEISDLTIAFNKIQDMTVQYVEQIKDNQDMLMEKERLASLGQMIGGISHNLKTPIMSIAGAAEGLTDLINEYDSSIGDKDVTNEDHHAIANDMKDWVDKIHSYTAYMSDIITAVKGQAVALSEAEQEVFTVDELVKRVDILMKHDLKNNHLQLNVNLNGLESTQIHGNVNSLVQVVNNLISNAIQSYDDPSGKSIELETKSDNKNITISIIDHGSGIPKDVQEKLFKSMITTKGKNGTGLGMFMSYSTIKGHFNGDMNFTTEIGKGTTFNIVLPVR